MTNFDRAAQLIERVYNSGGYSHITADALVAAGLLAPDLPEPDLDNRDPADRAEFEAWWEDPVPDVWNQNLPDVFTVQVFPDKPEVGLYFDLEPFQPFSPRGPAPWP